MAAPLAREPRLDARGQRSLGARSVALAGALFALLVMLVVATFLLYERRERLRAESDYAQLAARVLEDHATRSIDTAALALSALAELVSTGAFSGDVRLDWVLAQSIAGLPVLRDVAVLSPQGLVLASTDGRSRNRVIDLRPLGPLPEPDQERLGALVQGRGLGALVTEAAGDPSPPGVGFLPLMRHVRTPLGQSLLLVGLINPDAMSTHQQLLLADRQAVAALAGLDRQVLAATTGHPLLPGARMPDVDVFKRILSGKDAGAYVGAGAGPGDRVVAFRASRTRPLVVVVESAVDTALAAWAGEARTLGLGAAVVALAILLLSQLAARSLMARQRAQLQRDQAQAETALRNHELSVIVKSVQELLFRTDARGRLSFVNARWSPASGTDERQALGRELCSLVRPESAAAARALFAENGPAGLRLAELHMGPDGQVRQFDVAVAPLLDGGAIVGYAGSAIDVTEQRTAQARLQAQLAFTELMLEVLPVPMSILDAQSRYVSVNLAWQEFTGRRRADVLGEPAGRHLPPAEAQAHARRDTELLARGGRLRYESTATHADGSVRDLAVTKAALPGPGGAPSGILVAFMDVTEFREAERATREARDAAEEASRAKTEFIANISHELRTPLQSILGFSELGRARSGEQRSLGAMFGDIHAAGHRMLALVNDLLDVAKIESTVGTFHLERVDLRALVRDVAGELAPQLDAKRIALDLQLGPSPMVAKVDPSRFQQVVRNVLANAIRFSPAGRPLQVSADLDDDQQVRLRVRDFGPGIPPAELDKIFEAFVQSSTTKDGSGGTGLGLAISRKILQAHGGSIRAQNNPDGGATFEILMPTRGFESMQSQA